MIRPPPPKETQKWNQNAPVALAAPLSVLFPLFLWGAGGGVGGAIRGSTLSYRSRLGGGHFETRPYKWQRKLRFCADRATAGRRRAAPWRGAAGRLAAGGCLVGSVRDSTRQLRGGVCAFWGVRGVSARGGLRPATRPFLGRLVKVAGKPIDTNG